MTAVADRPVVGVVVLGWNTIGLLDECLHSVRSQTHPRVRAIYVDQGSRDGSVDHVRAHHPAVEVIALEDNVGFAAGNNLAIARLLADPECRAVVTLNSDARLEPGWIAAVVAFAGAHPDAACLQGVTYNHHRRDEIDSLGIYLSRRGDPRQIGVGRTGVAVDDGEVFGVNAAAALYTRTFLERQPFGADYFDPDLFAYYEDVEISARALALGMRNYRVASAVAFHMGGGTIGDLTPLKVRLMRRNLLPVWVKCVPARQLVPMLAAYAALQPWRLLLLVRAGRRDLLGPALSGLAAGLAMVPAFWRKRRALRPGRGRPPAEWERLMRPPGQPERVRRPA